MHIITAITENRTQCKWYNNYYYYYYNNNDRLTAFDPGQPG